MEINVFLYIIFKEEKKAQPLSLNLISFLRETGTDRQKGRDIETPPQKKRKKKKQQKNNNIKTIRKK